MPSPVAVVTRASPNHELPVAERYDIYTNGITPEGYARWQINTEFRTGDALKITPWPPPGPVVVVARCAGRFRSLFSWRPEDGAMIQTHLPQETSKITLTRGGMELETVVRRCICPPGTTDPHCHPFPSQPEPVEIGKEDPVEDTFEVDQNALVEAVRGIKDPIVLWWVNAALAEAAQTVTKAREYGSAELEYAGHVIGRIGGRETSKAEALELQIFHYVLGKMGRWVAAVTRGEQVSDDTLLDIGVYVRMVQYVREHGQWVD